MSERDPTAPNLATLRGLDPRKMAREKIAERLSGKGVKMSLPSVPTRVCNICGKGFDFVKTSGDVQLQHDKPCLDCQKNLDDGYTAFISDNRFVFAKSDRLADMAGQVVIVETHVMDAMEGKYRIEKKFVKPSEDADK